MHQPPCAAVEAESDYDKRDQLPYNHVSPCFKLLKPTARLAPYRVNSLWNDVAAQMIQQIVPKRGDVPHADHISAVTEFGSVPKDIARPTGLFLIHGEQFIDATAARSSIATKPTTPPNVVCIFDTTRNVDCTLCYVGCHRRS